MIENFLDYFSNKLNIFDSIFVVIMIYCVIQSFLKGFSLSFISFMKWVLAVIITIILAPRLQPWINNYIKSDFINSVGLNIFIFIISLFLLILLGKSLGKVVKWTGLGSIDKTFGLLFGFFKGYIVSICVFSIANWFYPYQNWGISYNDSISFNYIKSGSDILIEEFPRQKEFENTKDKIEKI